MKKRKDREQSGLSPAVMGAMEQPGYVHRPKVSKPHLAQEMLELGHDDQAKSLTYKLFPHLQRRLLTPTPTRR